MIDFDDFLSESCTVPNSLCIFDEENQEWIFMDNDSDEAVKQRVRILLGLNDTCQEE